MSDGPKPEEHAQVQEAPPKPANPWPYRLRLFFALVLPIFMETLDYTIVATAQPHIASSFGRLDLQGWIGTAYLLTSTVFLPLYASLADVFGRHWALQTSLVWFIVGSAISTGAQNMPMMLAGRGIAGVGAAGFLTVVRIIFADARNLDENTFQAMMMVLLYAIGYSVGPVIGGALTSVSFRWVFAINLPTSILSMILLFVLLRGRIKGPQPSSRQRERNWETSGWTTLDKFLTIDLIGACLFMAGGILILLGLTWGSTVQWNATRVIVSFVVGGVLILLCLTWEFLIDRYDDPERKRAPPRILEGEPMIPIPLFKNLDSIICQFASFTSGMCMFVAFYFVAIFFTIVSGKDATQAGVQLIFFAPGMGAGVILSTRMIAFLRQPRYPVVLSGLIIPISLGLISRAIQTNNQKQINGFMAMLGAGVGLSFAPLGIHAQFSQPPNRVAIVQSLLLFFRTLGGTVGIAQCGAVMNAKVKASVIALVQSGAIDPSLLPASKGAEAIASLDTITHLPPAIQDAIREAYRNGTRWAFLSLIPWAGVTFFMVLFLSRINEDAMTRPPAKTASSSEPKEDHDVEAAPPVLTQKEAAPTASATPSEAPEETQPPQAEIPGKPTMDRVRGPISLVIFGIRRGIWAIRNRSASNRA